MGILDDLRKAALVARRDGGKLSAFYSFVISEIVNIGKNKGNRETTEEEALSVLKKLIDKAKSNLALVKDEANIQKFTQEIKNLEVFIPAMATDDDILLHLNELWQDMGAIYEIDRSVEFKNKGMIAKYLKDKFGMLVDMKHALALWAEHFGDK